MTDPVTGAAPAREGGPGQRPGAGTEPGHGRPDPLVLVLPDRRAVADVAGSRLLLTLVDLLAVQERAHVALTGGGLGSELLAAAAESSLRALVDWSRVHLWWGDERYLPSGDPERNETQNRAALLDRLPLSPAQVHAVAGPDTSESATASATAYDRALRDAGVEGLDLVLLGMGPDGHIASLFPRHPAQRVGDALATAVADSPKPPPVRVSLTFAALARARRVWLLVAGRDKAAAVCRALTPGTDPWQVPAAGVRAVLQTRWLLDVAAAADLPPGPGGAPAAAAGPDGPAAVRGPLEPPTATG